MIVFEKLNFLFEQQSNLQVIVPIKRWRKILSSSDANMENTNKFNLKKM